ncbi:T-complex protein 11-like protein 1 isoform X2 [Haliotis rufescens]|uniref:T-complex protein 11-like protein 1 isoform X2 n=1 Tax=Haliotis rufescens TaxID=6454 RepID=UPI00201ED962|nr:T-complex protein 11-like protein 1 isoform X2 [Haliotis rufescens]
MAEKGENSPETLNNLIDAEVNSEGDENGLNSSNSETENKKRRTRTPSPPQAAGVPGFMVAASPPKFVSFEQLMEAANGVRNMTLAHEIVVDGDFKLETRKPQKNSVQSQVQEVVHKAFWDLLHEEISQEPPEFKRSLVLIEEVKEVLLSLLLPQHVRLRAQVNEVLDLELIEQKMENEAFDIHYYADYVVGIMGRLCAPLRDDQIAKLKGQKEVVPLFKEIFEVLDLMKMDMANFTIQQMRPYLQQQSVEYERNKFQEFLKTQDEHGTDGLQFSKVWLKRSFEQLLVEEEPLGEGATAGSKFTPASIMNEAYMELLQWKDDQVFPETLLMDQGRILELRDKTRQLTLVASVLLVTYSTVGAPIAGIQDLKTTLKSNILTVIGEEKDFKKVIVSVLQRFQEGDCVCFTGISRRLLCLFYRDFKKVIVSIFTEISRR